MGSTESGVTEVSTFDLGDATATPRETAILYGHDAAEVELARAFAGGRMHHGWLLAGR